LSIFVVDDEPVIAATTADVLKLHGHSSVSFTDPHDAIEAVKCGCPRLLIADLKMPGMSGLELAIQIKELCANCGILLFTAQIITPDLHTVASNYGFLILQKPSPPADLVLAVETMVGT
jgi:CheY-like chemotaxis protein